jgi:hypothetical protein
MPAILSEVYDAILEAGTSEEKARKAAEAVAGYEDRFGLLEGRMSALEGRMSALESRIPCFSGSWAYTSP